MTEYKVVLEEYKNGSSDLIGERIFSPLEFSAFLGILAEDVEGEQTPLDTFFVTKNRIYEEGEYTPPSIYFGEIEFNPSIEKWVLTLTP